MGYYAIMLEITNHSGIVLVGSYVFASLWQLVWMLGSTKGFLASNFLDGCGNVVL